MKSDVKIPKEVRTFKDGMLVCKDVWKKTAELLVCPRKRW